MATMMDTAFLDQYQGLAREAKLRFVSGVGIYSFPLLDRLAGFDHGFSARGGGVSEGYFSSLNLSFTRPENRDNVMENYRIFCRAAKIPYASMVMDNYEHGTTVLRVDRRDAGKGYLADPLPACDGLVTNDPLVTLITGHADCMAFYCVDPVRRCIGLAHAGWRGALGRIGARLVERMTECYGTNPADVFAAVGPSICPDCFEVGRNVAEEFAREFPGIPCVLSRGEERPHVDLWMIAFRQFWEAGVPARQFSLSNVCTMATPRLYSHRRDKGNTGGMAAYLRILPDGV
ncbi:MAG: peptidoglycan editing factor PgeF [Christensenella sp.]|nr:peptidoglycan editing factor PgeF [Christensenella sp.]